MVGFSDYMYRDNGEMIEYGYFCSLRPSHIVKRKYISLMTCDICVQFDYIRKSIDNALSLNHKCTYIERCLMLCT